jgi:twinkle protein
LPVIEQPPIKDRGISAEAVNKYKVLVQTDPTNPVGHVYPYFDEEGNHVANKIRLHGKKEFYWEGDYEKGLLFGSQLFPAGGKAITVVEGELDALSCWQLTGSKYAAVSVKSASSAKKDCIKSFEYLDSFEKIVLAFDADEPGQKAAAAVAQLFSPGKVHILKLQKGKDANEYLQAKLNQDFVSEWFKAPIYTPDGIRIGKDMWSDIENYQTPKSIPFPWDGLNWATYGIRLSEVTLFTADTGIGKTTFMKEIEHKLLMHPELVEQNVGVGILHFEETNYDTVIGLMSIDANKPFHLPDTDRTTGELRAHFDNVINNSRAVIYDHFGSNDIDTVLSKIRHMAALGCKYIVVDHLSIIVSDHAGDERKQLDEISTKLKMLCMNLGVAVITVIHQNRAGQVRGSAGPEQIANTLVKLFRDKLDPDPWRRNVTKVVVEKCRLSGRSGPCCYLYYNPETGRLEELSEEAGRRYEEGGNLAGHEFEAYG